MNIIDIIVKKKNKEMPAYRIILPQNNPFCNYFLLIPKTLLPIKRKPRELKILNPSY